MNSVITEITDFKEYNGVILFDGDCPICRSATARAGAFLSRHGFTTAALQTPWVRQRLQNDPKPLLAEMRLLTASGQVLGGADALLAIAAKIWWARPLYWLSFLPGLKPLFRHAYTGVARNRYCFGCSTCLRNGWWRLGYHATNVVFVYLPVVYLLAAWKGGTA
jgi:predicted DCC family thiol-disulfide oxidoreductase YuxK